MPGKVTRLSEAQADRLVRFYEQAEREILDRLNRALLRANKTEYLVAMEKNIEAILKQLRAGSRTWCMEAIPRVYVYGATMADRMITDAGLELKVGAGFGAIHQQAAQVLAENAFQRFEDVAQVIGRQTNDVYRELALENIRGTVVGYDTWQQTARGIREQLAERGVTGFTDRAGRKWNMRSYAEMVARTTTMESHLQGTANRLAEQGHDLIRVSSHRGACSLCVPWENRVLSLTGKTPGYPTLAEAKAAGLFHPNCAHAMSLYVDLDEEIGGPEEKVGKPAELPEPGRFESVKQALEWAKREHPHIRWEIASDMDIETINPTLKEFDALSKEFPGAAAKIKVITTKRLPIRNYMAAYDSARQAIHLNPKFYKDKQLYQKALDYSFNTGFHPSNEIGHVFAHEFGHHLDIYSRTYDKAFLNHVTVDGFGLVNETVRNFTNHWYRNRKRAIINVSGYAAESPQEAFAEAFAASRYGSKKHYVFVKALQKLTKMVFNEDQWSDNYEWTCDLVSIKERIDALEYINKLKKELGLL